MFRRELRHEVQRDTRRMGQRLIFVPDQTRQRSEELFRTDDDFVMVRFVSFGDEARVFELVGFTFGERD